LNDAHKAGVIHGDIKPANIRFGAGNTEEELGDAKLADFGAAKRLREEGPTIKGSTNWMAPELIESGDATPASDYFSFGVVAYLVLAGRHPYFANDPTCLTSEEDNIVNPTYRPEPLSVIRSDVPRAVADLIMELLARDTQARSRAEQALKAALSQPVEPEEPPGPPPARPVAPLAVEALTPEEAAQLEMGYEQGRRRFFVYYQPTEAIETLDQILQQIRWERFANVRVTRIADCWSLQAYIHNSAGLFENAVDAASNGLTVDPDHVSSLHARGYAYIQLGRYREAHQDLTRAFDLATLPTKRRQISGLLSTLRART
jgi:tetratricopeptide (TPR) repeat protein